MNPPKRILWFVNTQITFAKIYMKNMRVESPFPLFPFWSSDSSRILPKGFLLVIICSVVPVIVLWLQHPRVVPGKVCCELQAHMLFLSPCMSFLTHTRRFAFICNHCSLQNTGKRVIIITTILPRGKLRPRKVKWLTQRHTVNWRQSQDYRRGSLEVVCCSEHSATGPLGCVSFLPRVMFYYSFTRRTILYEHVTCL